MSALEASLAELDALRALDDVAEGKRTDLSPEHARVIVARMREQHRQFLRERAAAGTALERGARLGLEAAAERIDARETSMQITADRAESSLAVQAQYAACALRQEASTIRVLDVAAIIDAARERERVPATCGDCELTRRASCTEVRGRSDAPRATCPLRARKTDEGDHA